MNKKWQLYPANTQIVNQLKEQLGIQEALCELLALRGISNYTEAKQFFRPNLSELHDPFLMKDMHKAVQRIREAINSNEKILIYGDYDVDGTTSVAVMFQFLSSLYPNCDYYIPHRYREGYGVSKQGIEFAYQNGHTLIIALDCGIKSVEWVSHAKSLGIDFIICDHHLPDAVLPDAAAILNTKQQDCPYPFKELCGCGVGLKLIQALCSNLSLPDAHWMTYLDLVAIAIAADIVPIIGENRILTFFGLQKVNNNPSTGVKALLKLSKMEGQIHVNNLVFVIAPRVNAAGRMDDAKKAVELFIAKNEADAIEKAEQLHSDNSDRREVDLSITEQAIAIIDNDTLLQHKKSTVLHNENWHKGVVGIVASRLIEKYYRPTIILTDSGEKAAGSARSVLGFNIYEAIHACKDLLESYGGHFYAAGLTLKKENIPLFTQKFEQVVSDNITEEMLTPVILIDTTVTFKMLTDKFYNIICQMEPFGPQNMRPVFLAKEVYNTGKSKIVKENHIKFQLVQHGVVMEGIGFGMAEKFDFLQPNQPIDIVFTLDENEWNGVKKLQLRVIDFNKSGLHNSN